MLRYLNMVRTDTDRITWILLVTLLALLVGVAAFAADRLTGAMAVVAASGAGAFLGLLFSIPKRMAVPENQASTGEAARGPVLIANTSLEEISDWLTKTIVGVGLVSWSAVLAALDRAGREVGMAVTGDADSAQACGVALILAAAVHGGMCAYLWFSRYLPGEFIDAYGLERRTAAQGLSQAPAASEIATFGTRPSAPALHAPSTVTPPRANARAKRYTTFTEGSGQSPEFKAAVEKKLAQMNTEPIDIEDWALGMFGGEASVTNDHGTRTLKLEEVEKVGKRIFKVVLVVTGDPKPDTPCVFFLHNTFPNATPSVGFDKSGRATLTVTAWGAFTVGALTDDGQTELELNLALVPTAPREFSRY